MAQDDHRPDPDALLAAARTQEGAGRHGRLKILFGASPGVGKTYSMLLEARRLKAEGREVVVGVVETHGRTDTAALLKGLEVLPRKAVDYHGRLLQEFDLDGALARKPAILLVDELAHNNAPGSRHPKRWQDVEELLAAGIDVLSTVNVQHIESLKDIVGGITGIRIAETIPDHVFTDADEVVLVDLTPDDLLARLREGKVYIPEQAQRAIQNFFRKGNLIALRELALRQTADRVDGDIRSFRRTLAAAPVWQTRDTLVACIGPSDVDEKVVRTAARLAAKLDATWYAVYVETPALQRLPGAQRAAILKTLRLAQGLGAETATLSAQDPVQAVLDFTRYNNLGRIVIGRSTQRGLRRWLRGSFSQRLAWRSPDIDIVTVAREEQRPLRPPPRGGAEQADESHRRRRWEYLYAVLICTGITLGATPLLGHIELTNIVMLFLLGVLFVAYRFGRGPAVLMAFLGVASFDVFFVPPRLTLGVSDVQYLLTFAVMLVVGLVTGHLTAGLRYQARMATYREERTHSLYEAAKALSSALVEQQVVDVCGLFLRSGFDAKSIVLLPNASDKLEPPPAAHDGAPAYDLAVAQWCYDKNEPAGAGSDTLPAAAQLYLPLKAPIRAHGVLVIEPENTQQLLLPEQRRLLDTFAALVAIALERVHFVSVAQETLVRMESERLRNTLLAALSHDLRTPLTSLVGMAETLSLELSSARLPLADKADVIRTQALRITDLVNNLLDMAKLHSGDVKPEKDWQSFEEIVAGALRILEPSLKTRPLQVALAKDMPLIRCDAILIERVLANLLDNALKYTPAGTAIGIRAEPVDDELRVEVWDEGPGIPPGKERAIFEKFARGQKESAITGAGLGLAICDVIVKAHGGRIWAENRVPRGARFIFTLPVELQPAVEPEGQA
jgi:two-component system, OmpR family, sensor histidine kinase KdpD